MGDFIGLIGVVVGAVITGAWTFLSERIATHRQARYLAIRVVCILDKFADDCASVAGDDGLCCGQTNREGYHQVQVPVPPPLSFPEELNWRSIDCQLMYKILSLPNMIDSVNRSMLGDSELNSPPYDDFFEERRLQYARLGLKVSGVARELRVAHGIPDVDQGANLIGYMEEVRREIESSRSELESKRASSREIWPVDAL